MQEENDKKSEGVEEKKVVNTKKRKSQEKQGKTEEMAWEPKHVKKRGRGRSRKRKNMAQGINGKTRLQELGDANTQQNKLQQLTMRGSEDNIFFKRSLLEIHYV